MALVLVVDDRPVNRDLVRTVLGYYGHDTVDAADGAEALVLLERYQPDLVLTDVVMPVMDGYQLAREIRSDPIHQGTPVLFYTANYMVQEIPPVTGADRVSRIVPMTGDLRALIEAVEEALLAAG